MFGFDTQGDRIKVCLVNPGFGRLDGYKKLFLPPPLNLAYIASSLKGLADVEIMDCYAKEMGIEQCLKKICESKPDIIGIIPNNYCDFVMGDLEKWIRLFSAKMKSIGLDAATVAGGPFASTFPERALRYADFVIRGDQEIVFRNLIENLGDEKELKNTTGLCSRLNNKTHINKPYFTNNLDSISFPSRELLETKIYGHILIDKPMTTFLTTRGCPYNCVYCSRRVYGPYRERSVENVMEELREVVNMQKNKNIVFYDDNFTINRKRAARICDLIVKEGIDIKWICATRVDLVDKNLLEKMKRAGCSVIAYGVESGDQKVLDKIKKNIKIDKTKKAFELTRKAGIKILSYVIIGSPGETKESVEKTFRLIKRLEPDYVQFNPITIYPGSEIYGKGPKEICMFTQDELIKIQREVYKRYYLRGNYILDQFKKIRSFGDIKRGFHALRFITS